MKLNLGSGAYPLDGFENLDKQTGWTFESGLPYEDASIEAITISHALMYVALADWPFVFSEFARVLEPGGVVRITEDETNKRHSPRWGGFVDPVTRTRPIARTGYEVVRDHLEDAGLDPQSCGPGWSFFRDGSLIQSWHGLPPKVFHCEGLKPPIDLSNGGFK